MEIDLNNITFIIVSFKSENVIYKCIDSLPKQSKKIIIENSKNIKLKKDLELKYDNIEVVMNDNTGMGASNNLGISMSNTEFVYILNPDTKFTTNTFKNLIETSKTLNDFAILSPICSDKNLPNYKIFQNDGKNKNDILEVDTIDGFSMLINKSKFNGNYFDENFFLYLENDDLCLRTKKNDHKIYIIKNATIDHLGASSSEFNNINDFEYLRNWHWMWSKFYFNKKHYGFLFSIFKIFPNFISSVLKFIFYILLFNVHKKNIYKMRILGLFNSILGKKSFFRPD